MSFSPISAVTRSATRSADDPLNILTFVTHERYEPNLCKTGHEFFAYGGEGIRDWNTNYAAIPQNYHLLDKRLEGSQIPLHLDIDLVLCQNVMAHFPTASQIASALNTPLVNLCHILPPTNWSEQEFSHFKRMSGSVDVFISDYNRKIWGRDESNSVVIYHGVDTEFWSPPNSQEQRLTRIFSVVNDWVNRDWCCGYKIWERITPELPTYVRGDTPGLSTPANSVEELRDEYSQSQIFLNTSTYSPIPCSLLEAMSCECAVVSTATCLVPEIIENGVNGFCSNDEDELREYLVTLLNDPALCRKLGREARKTIQEKFSMNRFVEEWDELFKGALDA